MKNDKSKLHFEERPSCMQIQISQAVVSNCRIGAKCSQSDVLNDLQHFIGSRLYADMTCFPNEKDDIPPLSNSSWLNDYSVNHYQINQMTKRDKELYSRLARDDNLPHQIWCIWCEQVWVEFLGTPKLGSRRITFVDAFPLRLWICEKVPCYDFQIFSETSSIQGSDIEVASEFVDQNYPIRQMNVVYDSEKGPVATTQHKERRRSHSRTNSHHENKRLLDAATGGCDESAHLFNANSYMLEDIDGMRNIRSSHSESDLLQIRDREVVSGSVSVHDINYAQGGPPPPYYSSDSKIVSSSVSMTSLPPAYETISEEPGPIVKPAIGDFKICDTERFFENQSAAVAILVNIDKPILVQMEHFQLLYLLRVGEAVAEMTERINMDNKLCEKERTASLNQWRDVEQTSKAEQSLILNARIPDIFVDIVLPPCIGIDPVQRLTLPERVQYEKEKLESITESLTRESMLPLRKISIQNAVLENPSISENFRNNDVTLGKNDVTLGKNDVTLGKNDILYRENGIAINAEIDGAYNSRDHSSEYFEDVLPELHKEFKDEAIQVGEALMTVNLKPLPEDQLISVLRIQASIITLTVQSKDDDSVVKVAAETLRINELGNMKYGKVVDPRGHIASKDSDKQQVNMNTITGDCVFKMRLLSGPKAEVFAPGSKDIGFADIRVKSIVAAFLMSTIDNLTEFGEDEYILPMMPFTVDVSESDISLYDDKPRRYKSNAKLPPLQILLSGLTIERDINGVMKLNQKARIEEARHSVSGEMDGIIGRNRNSSMIAESINQQVEALISENGRLLEDLKVVNAKVNGLHTERESLLKVIDKLQKELMHSNRENDDLHMRVRSLSLRKQKGHYI